MKRAICFGINAYSQSPIGAGGGAMSLQGCIKDSETMEAIFDANGFETSWRFTDHDVNYENLRDLIAQFATESKEDDQLGISFSGHGTYRDAYENGKYVRHTGIVLWDRILWDSDFKMMLAAIPAKRGVQIYVDACFSQDNYKMYNGLAVNTKVYQEKYVALKYLKSEVAVYTSKVVAATKIKCNVISINSSTLQEPSFDMGPEGGLFTLSIPKAMRRKPKGNYMDTKKAIQRVMTESGLPQHCVISTVNGNDWAWTYRSFLS